MDEKELREIMKLLEDAGMDPQLCDTMLPHYLGKASCGVPLESSGDIEEMIPVPKALLSWGLQYFIKYTLEPTRYAHKALLHGKTRTERDIRVIGGKNKNKEI